ncbi:flagellar biosynthetic protein FliO [Treponema sp. Marseille-Q3903]|uniref:FliO/MopB family protein n=1 Tax=Treponema sp. Marseille-Q3903 TaxID=2766703 RepID=UPI0016524663|nr:flagellar biosynthetic protein FliO [Treponema sp. Marseille-Q3903]MBC6713700.1 flagellar biosynthetic protein FliO [Treponema sp. Marseille-Q3903]
MGKSKKIIVATILFFASVFCIYSQNNQSEKTQDNQSVTESQISLNFDDAAGTDSNNLTTQNKRPSTVLTFVRMIVALIIVVALIYGVLWFVKKKTNVVKTDDEYLRRAAYINIAPGKTIEVITLIDKAYLIGVTEDSITMLGEIDDDELIKAMNLTADKKTNIKKATSFSEVLDMFLIKGNKQKNIFSDSEKKVEDVLSKTQREGIDNSSENNI